MPSSRLSCRLAPRVFGRALVALAMAGLLLVPAAWAAEAAEPLRAAVMRFQTPPADVELAPMGAALADMLATDLAVAPDLRLVERIRLRDIQTEIALGKSGAVDRSTAARAGKLLGADMLILGSVHAFRPKMRIDVRVVAAASGEVVVSASAEGTLDAFFDVETDLAKRLLAALGSTLTPLAKMRIGRGQTAKLPAALAYGRGLLAEDRGDRDGARKAFAEALVADPAFASATRRLAALETRVEALEARTQAVETAGGRILRPTTVLDHWHNATLARSRGDEATALRDVQLVLAQAPAALDAIALWVTLGGDPKLLAEPTRALAVAARAVERNDSDAAIAATKPLDGRPSTTSAAALAEQWLRLRALGLRPDAERSAEERQELAALAWTLQEPSADAGIFIQGEAREQAARSLAHARAWAEQGVAFGYRRRELLERPAMVAFPERGHGKGQPWLRVDVRIAETASSSVVVRVVAGKERRTWTPVLQRPSPWGSDATYWTVECPDPPVAEPIWTVEIERADVRGRPRVTTLTLQAPTVWGGNWRALGSSIGHWSEGSWPMLGVRLGAMQSRPDHVWTILVDASAKVWGQVDEPKDHGWLWQPLWAGIAGPAANGVAYWDHRIADGSRAIGLRLPLVVLRQRQVKVASQAIASAPADDAEPLALGSLVIERRWAADGRATFRSGARAGLLDGPLDGSEAALDVEIVVASLVRAGQPRLAKRALALAQQGLTPLGLVLWHRDARHLLAEAALGPPNAEVAASDVATGSPAASEAASGSPGTAVDGSALRALERAPDPSIPARIGLRGGVWLDRDAVSADDYAGCVQRGACAAISTDRCHERGPDLHGDQPASCMNVSPNPYPITRVRKEDAKRYCAFAGGTLPTQKQWREAMALTKGTGNARDALSCAWQHADLQSLPETCHPQRSQSAIGWDGHAWLAPTGHSSARLPGNVRVWLADGADLVAGCSYLDDARSGDACETRTANLAMWTDQGVGIRCVGRTEHPPKQAATPQRKAATSHTSLRWRPVPAGEVVIGLGGERPALTLPAPSAASVDAVAKDVPGLTTAQLGTFVKALEALHLQGTWSAKVLEELLARGRWRGQPPELTLRQVATMLATLQDDAIRPLGLGIPIDSLRRMAQRKGTEAALPQTVHDELLRDLRRDVAETPKPDDAVVWHEDRPLFCDDRAPGSCEDATGTASNRITMRARTFWKVKVDRFEMLETEVTQEAYTAVMLSEPSLWSCPQCAVERVTWREADAFCRAIGGQLPTEAQWSRAVRGDFDTLRPAGLDTIAWYRANSGIKPHAVGGKAAGPFGHRDLLGSVWEWLRDGWEDGSSYGYAQRPPRLRLGKELDPSLPPTQLCLTNGRALREIEANASRLPWVETKRHGPVLCFADEAEATARVDALLRDNPQGPPPAERRRRHVLVGGSYGSDERLVHAASRVGYDWQQRSPFVGFRCVRAAP